MKIQNQQNLKSNNEKMILEIIRNNNEKDISQADIVLYMTQDAIPADNRLTERFVEVFKSNPEIGIAYGRQLPRED